MRTDIWFSKSSIPHVINEILATLQGKRTFTLIGSELKEHYNNEYDTYDLPEFKIGHKSDKVDVVVFAAPQLSLDEMRILSEMLDGRKIHPNISLIVCTAPSVKVLCDTNDMKNNMFQMNLKGIELAMKNLAK